MRNLGELNETERKQINETQLSWVVGQINRFPGCLAEEIPGTRALPYQIKVVLESGTGNVTGRIAFDGMHLYDLVSIDPAPQPCLRHWPIRPNRIGVNSITAAKLKKWAGWLAAVRTQNRLEAGTSQTGLGGEETRLRATP